MFLRVGRSVEFDAIHLSAYGVLTALIEMPRADRSSVSRRLFQMMRLAVGSPRIALGQAGLSQISPDPSERSKDVEPCGGSLAPDSTTPDVRSIYHA